jgi:thioesterase domain-containing protein
VRLLGRIERDFGVVLPVSILLETRTVRGLAHEIDRKPQVAAETPLVLIQQGTSPYPVFCVHPVGGEVLCYRNLAVRLGTNRTVYGLRALADTIERNRPSIEQLAFEYVSAIRSVQQHGPYHLVGFSFGGALVYEMGRQLHKAGEQIHLLAIVDTNAPGFSRGDGQRPSLFEMGSRLWFWVWDDLRTDRLAEIAHRLWRKFCLGLIGLTRGRDAISVASGYYTLADRVMDLKFPGYRADLVRALGTAQQQYAPQPYSGRITLIRGRALGLRAVLPEKGWRALAGTGVDIVVVPGSHFRMLQNPRTIEMVAHALRKRIGGSPTDPVRSESAAFPLAASHDPIR